ncbi:MAG: NUDIX domain-containing protein [Bacteroidota bacterium]
MNVKVFVKIISDKKLLLIKKSDVKYQHKWYLPGGTVTEKESLTNAAMRLTALATGYDIAINGIYFLHYITRPVSLRGLYIYYSGRILDGKLKSGADDYTLESGWFDQKSVDSLELWFNMPEIIQMGELPLISTSQLLFNQD